MQLVNSATHSPIPAVPAQNFPHSEVIPGILVMRLDAPLYFANSLHFEEKVAEYLEDADEVSRSGGGGYGWAGEGRGGGGGSGALGWG